MELDTQSEYPDDDSEISDGTSPARFSLGDLPPREAICRLRTIIRLRRWSGYWLPLESAPLHESTADQLQPEHGEDDLIAELMDVHFPKGWRHALGGSWPQATAPAGVSGHAHRYQTEDATQAQIATTPSGENAAGAQAESATCEGAREEAVGQPAASEIATSRKREIATSLTPVTGHESLELQGLEESQASSCAVARPPAPCSRHTGMGKHSHLRKVDRKRNRRPAARYPAWEKASDDQKLEGAMKTAASLGGYTVNLNLTEESERTLRRHEDPIRLLSGYVNRNMKKVFGHQLPYVLVLEVSPDGRLHVHGAVVPLDRSLSHKKQLVDLFRNAAGRIKGKAGSRQCVLKDMVGPEGWTRYVRLDRRKTTRELGSDRLTFLSQPMRSMTRQGWGDIRWGSGS